MNYRSEIVRFDFDPNTASTIGEPQTIHTSNGVLVGLEVTPDGNRIVFTTDRPNEDILVMNADGTGRRRVTNDRYKDRGPIWVDGGRWVLFYSNRDGSYEIWRIRPDGTGAAVITESSEKETIRPLLTADVTVHGSGSGSFFGG